MLLFCAVTSDGLLKTKNTGILYHKDVTGSQSDGWSDPLNCFIWLKEKNKDLFDVA